MLFRSCIQAASSGESALPHSGLLLSSKKSSPSLSRCLYPIAGGMSTDRPGGNGAQSTGPPLSQSDRRRWNSDAPPLTFCAKTVPPVTASRVRMASTCLCRSGDSPRAPLRTAKALCTGVWRPRAGQILLTWWDFTPLVTLHSMSIAALVSAVQPWKGSLAALQVSDVLG